MLTSDLFDEIPMHELSCTTNLTEQKVRKDNLKEKISESNHLFSKFSDEENTNFLKGLLIYGNKWQLVSS